jgi:hypothetical protein
MPSAESGRLSLFRRLNLERWALAGVLLLFLLTQFIFPDFPGTISMDGLKRDQALAGLLWSAFQEEGFWGLFFSGSLPVARAGYHGSLMSFLYLPFYVLFGPEWFLARSWHVFFEVGALVFTFLVVRNLYGSRVALLSLLFLVIHPNYVAGVRFGAYMVSHLHFFSMGALYFLARAWKTGRWGAGFWGLFFIGMGMSMQLWFWWFPIALTAAAWVYRRQLGENFSESDGRRVLSRIGFGLSGLPAGAALILYREWAHPLDSLRAFYHRVTIQGGGISEPGGIVERLANAAWYLTAVFPGGNSDGNPFDGYPSWVSVNGLFPIALLAAGIYLIARDAAEGGRRLLALFPFLLVLLTVMASIFPTFLPHWHFFYPLPAVVLSLAAAEAWSRSRGRAKKTALAAACLILTVQEVRGVAGFFQSIQPQANDRRLYDLVKWLRTSGSGSPLVLCSGNQYPRLNEFAGYSLETWLYCLVPERRFRFYRPAEDRYPEAGCSYAARKNPAPGEIAVVFLEGDVPAEKTAEGMPGELRHLFPRGLPPPTARFGGPGDTLVFQTYAGPVSPVSVPGKPAGDRACPALPIEEAFDAEHLFSVRFFRRFDYGRAEPAP